MYYIKLSMQIIFNAAYNLLLKSVENKEKLYLIFHS